jgi:glutaredoxin-related protein
MTQTPKRPLLDASKISSEALAKIVESHADVVRDVERAIGESPVVVIGMAQNPHVRKVRKALTSAGIEHRYLEFGSYVSEWRRRLAIKLWSGWPTFPQVFVNGSLIGGEDLTVAAIDNGKLKKMLER